MAALGTTLGAWLRYLILKETNNFYWLLVPTAFSACFQPFLCNGVSKLSTAWFGDNERALATTIGSLANPLGCIMGLVLGPIFIPDLDQKLANPIEYYDNRDDNRCHTNPLLPECIPNK